MRLIMKSKVKTSTFSSILTIAVTAILVYALYDTYGTSKFGLIAFLVILLWAFALMYAPIRVELVEDRLIMRHPFKKTKLRLEDISAIEPYQPTMGEIRILGSGGYFGHWGIFRAGDIGKYTGYYGKSSDCFLIRMKNGDKYVFGCQNASEMIETVNQRIR